MYRAQSSVLSALLSLADNQIGAEAEKLTIKTECNQTEIAALARYSTRHAKRSFAWLKSQGVIVDIKYTEYTIDLRKVRELFGDLPIIDALTLPKEAA